MQTIETLIQILYDWVSNFFDLLATWFVYGLLWVFNGFLVMLNAIVGAILLGISDALAVIFSVVFSFAYVIDFMASLSQLPSSMLYLMDACGFADAMAILAEAYFARLLINLIPAEFTRV